MSEAELKLIIQRQQSDSGLLPLELFCVACGCGHIATPGGGDCRKCVHHNLIYRKHPKRKQP